MNVIRLRMSCLLISLSALTGALAGKLYAHEVSASSVKVHIDGPNLEIWQTTPLITAQETGAALLSRGSPSLPTSADKTDSATLERLASGWRVEQARRSCHLQRQAHRRIHHDTQLQLRYLYRCKDEQGPVRLTLSWLEETPPDHFVLFEVRRGEERQTQVLQRNQNVLWIERAPEGA